MDSIPKAGSARGPSVAKTPRRKGSLASHVCRLHPRLLGGFQSQHLRKEVPPPHSEEPGVLSVSQGIYGTTSAGKKNPRQILSMACSDSNRTSLGSIFCIISFVLSPPDERRLRKGRSGQRCLSLKENKHLQEGRLKAARNLAQPCTPDLRQNLLRHSSWNHSEIPASLIRT